MFNKNMGAVAPFVNDVAGHLFGNITGTSFNDDWSFLATLRAFLFRRMPKEDHVDLQIYRREYDAETIQTNDAGAVMDAIFNKSPNTINVVNYRADDQTIEVLFNMLDDPEKGFVKHFGGREQKDIEEQVKNFTNIRFYVNSEKRNSTILVQNMNLQKYHFIQILTVRALPWYFEHVTTDGGKTTVVMSDQEKELIKSFREKYAPVYENAIAKIAEQIDFRDATIMAVLGDFEKKAHEAQAETVRNEISSTQRAIRDNEQRYKVLIDQLQDQNIRLNGLLYIVNNGGDESELIDYFRHNKSLTPIDTCGTELRFIVKTFLEFFDENIFERYRDNGVMYRDMGAMNGFFRGSIEHRKKLIDAIFSEEPRLRVKLCGYFKLNTEGSVTSARDYNFPKDCDDYLPNPHFKIHNCLGNNRTGINEALARGNVVGAIEQCISATKGVNMTEIDQTISRFLRWIYDSGKKIIRLEDGRDVTPKEAVEWLDEQAKAQEEEKK